MSTAERSTPSVEAAGTAESEALAPTGLGWYFGSASAWFAGAGVQAILLPWLVTIVLDETADRVGIAQAAALLPGLVLTLVGGMVADRSDCRNLLVRVHLASAVPHALLALVFMQATVPFWGLVGYAVCAGSIAAFAPPARDSMLSRVAGGRIQKTVTTMLGVQNGSQLCGIVLGGTAVYTGAPIVLLAQSGMLALGGLIALRLPHAPPSVDPARQPGLAGALSDIRAGLTAVFHDALIGPVTLLAVAIGACFMGTFMVAMPVMIRDVYGGSSPEIAGVQVAMFVGMVSMLGLLLRIGGIRNKARALLASLAIGAILLCGLVFEPPLFVAYALIVVWGALGGIAMTSSRTLVQEAASETHRARILSIYQLGFTGAAPVGALVMGVIVREVGPTEAILYPMGLMLAAVAVVSMMGLRDPSD